eukprot:gene17656-24002_t
MDDSFPEFLAMQGSEPLGLDAGDGGMPPPPRVDTTAAGVLDLMRCQVVGCPSDLVLLKEYHQRYKICETHLKQPEVMVNDELHRFCQQCGRFHVLEEFDDNKRSCRERLRKHNERRRKKGKEKLKGGEEHVGIGRLVGGGLMLPAEFLGDSYSKRARAEGAEGGYYSDCSTRCTGSSFASSMDSKDSLGSYFGNSFAGMPETARVSKVQPRTHSNLGPRPNFGSPIPEEEAHYHTVQGATFHGSGGGGLEPCPTQVFMGSPGGSGQDWALEGGPGTHSASHGQVGGSRGAGVGGPAQEWVGPRSLTAGEWAAQVTEGRPSQSPPIHRMMTVDRTQLSSHTGRGSPSLQLPTTPCSQDGSARGQGGIAQGQGGLVQGQGGNFYPLRPESAAGGHRSHEQQQRPRTPLGGLNLAEPPLPFMRTAPPQGSQLAQGDQHYTQAGQSYSPSQGGYMKEEEYADRRVLRGVRAAPHGSVMQPPFLGFTSLLMDPVVEQNHPNRPAQVLIHTQDHAQGGPGQMGHAPAPSQYRDHVQGGPGQMGHAPAPSQYQDHVQGGPGQMGHAPTPSQYQDHVQGGPGQMGHALVPSQYQDHVQGGPGQMGHALAPSQYQDHVQGGPGQMGHAPAPSQYVDHLQGGPGQMGHAPAPSQYHALEYHTLPPNPRESSSNIPMTSSDMLQQNYQNRPNYHNQQNYQTTAVQQPQQWDTLDHMGSSVSGRQAASPLGWEPNTLNEYGGNNYQQ